MSETLDLSIPKNRLAPLSAALVVAALLLFAAGIITGMMLSPQVLTTGRQKLPGNPLHAASSQQPSPPAALSSPSPPGLLAPKTKPTPTKAGREPDLGPPASQLAVQVVSFDDRIRAQSFADSLKRQGFPSLSLGTVKTGEQTWYSVRLGPYTDWDTASRAAAEVQRSYDVQTYVRTL
jgi:cell division septation protein DedD